MHITEHADSLTHEETAESLTEQAIRERAYQLYELRGGEDGHAQDDWYKTESELLSDLNQNKAA